MCPSAEATLLIDAPPVEARIVEQSLSSAGTRVTPVFVHALVVERPTHSPLQVGRVNQSESQFCQETST